MASSHLEDAQVFNIILVVETLSKQTLVDFVLFVLRIDLELL